MMLRAMVHAGVFAAFLALGMLLYNVTNDRSQDGTGHSLHQNVAIESITARPYENSLLQHQCPEGLRELSTLENVLEERRRELDALQNLETDGHIDSGTSSALGQLDEEQRLRIQELLEHRQFRGLTIECSEEPCIVFGSGKREIVDPLAAMMTQDENLTSLHPVVVTRIIVGRDRQPDTISAIGLLSKDEYDDVEMRALFESELRARVARIQD